MKCTVNYIVYLQCTFSLACMKVRDPNILAWVLGQRMMSQVLDVFGLLDFNMLWLVTAWHTF
jgi:ABC-type long-subunit fatty acid transport system fused permease/ATPase subunit